MNEKKETSTVKAYRVLNDRQESSSLFFDSKEEMREHFKENEISDASWDWDVVN